MYNLIARLIPMTSVLVSIKKRRKFDRRISKRARLLTRPHKKAPRGSRAINISRARSYAFRACASDFAFLHGPSRRKVFLAADKFSRARLLNERVLVSVVSSCIPCSAVTDNNSKLATFCVQAALFPLHAE